MPALQRVFYISRVADPGQPPDMKRILGRSRMSNRRLDITGMLAHSGRHFAQVLEGPTADVDALVEKVAADPRHIDFKVIFRKPIEHRAYGEWEMGYIEGFGASEHIEALIDMPAFDAAAAERFAVKLFAPTF